ncbi:hypothetical protein GWK47_033753 [Chionoecetes opilio]|uniref:Uncharacterized protein n=1 Tax=Chionoecetes opilio TaxID=41210 RepID=A0A8J4YGY3_CHIOP|nr:hypothetical protein GWK47_033753 [Chionoecetes opilio]
MEEHEEVSADPLRLCDTTRLNRRDEPGRGHQEELMAWKRSKEQQWTRISAIAGDVPEAKRGLASVRTNFLSTWFSEEENLPPPQAECKDNFRRQLDVHGVKSPVGGDILAPWKGMYEMLLTRRRSPDLLVILVDQD